MGDMNSTLIERGDCIRYQGTLRTVRYAGTCLYSRTVTLVFGDGTQGSLPMGMHVDTH